MSAGKNKRLDLFLSGQAKEDIAWWEDNDRRTLPRIRALIDNCRDMPFSGLGKPEPLKHALSGSWSRRITKEHRLVYMVEAGTIFVLSCRFHYPKK